MAGCSVAASDEHRNDELAAPGQVLRSSPNAKHCSAVGARDLELALLGTHRSGLFGRSAAEIVRHDPASQRLFVVNAALARIDVLDIRRPSAPARVGQIDLSGRGARVSSVDVHGGVVAVAILAAVKTEPGAVALLDAASLRELASVQVGALPDMLTFTPDGHHVLVANEGEPSDDYRIDPEGSVSVIDVSRGAAHVTQADVRTADFRALDPTALDPDIRVFGPDASLAQDLEPEYVAVASDGKRAWVSLQENNALAVIDIQSARVEKLVALGYKDHAAPGNGLDPSDRDGAIAIASWPVFGMFQPDAIASYARGGQSLLVLANEGDARDYSAFTERARVGDLRLDPVAFPAGSSLRRDARLGRLKVTRTAGDVDRDGDYDALYAFGARSVSIRTADGTLLWDSGDGLERELAAAKPATFNASNDDNEFDSRSDDKGHEPEAIALGTIAGHTYAFVGLERVGGVMTYDVTNPHAPCFAGYTNNRDFDAAPGSASAGDLGPEGLEFISAGDSPIARPLLAVANEISGTTSLFEIRRGR